MTSNDYTGLLARFRRLLRSGGVGHEPLPDFLLPEQVEVSDEVRDRARLLRDHILRGDLSAVREASPELSSTGFNRAEGEAPLPELDDARARVQERLRKKGEAEDDDDSPDTSADRRGRSS